MVELILTTTVVIGNTLRDWDHEPLRNGKPDYFTKLLSTVLVVGLVEVIWAMTWTANH